MLRHFYAQLPVCLWLTAISLGLWLLFPAFQYIDVATLVAVIGTNLPVEGL
jgi:hypothetical protein